MLRAIVAGIAVSAVLVGCGGGEGGGVAKDASISGNANGILSGVLTSLSFQYYRDGSTRNPVSYIYARDLDNDGVDEIFFVSFETQPNTAAGYSNTSIHIFGWESGGFKELTSKWLPGSSNEVEGVGDVCFGDFNGDGKVDVFLSAYTDMNHPAHPYALINNGTYFSKVKFDLQTWMHGIVCADVNRDGFDDVLVAGYANFPQYLGSRDGLIPHSGMVGSSGITAGDFLGNGTIQAVVVDADGNNSSLDTKLLSIDVNSNNKTVVFNLIANLPGPRLDTQYADPSKPNSSHDIRAVAIDFNHDGKLDVVVFGYRYDAPDSKTFHRSEIQFLQNKGGGAFEDVTESTRVGFDITSAIGYYPIFRDFNGDGLVDLFVSAPDWFSSGYRSTSLLLQDAAGRFVDTARSELNSAIESGGGQAIIARGPAGKSYLVKEGAWKSDGFTRISIHSIKF